MTSRRALLGQVVMQMGCGVEGWKGKVAWENLEDLARYLTYPFASGRDDL